MFANFGFQSLALSVLLHNSLALDFDANNLDSIKSVAKTLASGIAAAYKDSAKVEGGIPGLFDEESYYWWESGAVFGGLIDYAHLTGDTQFNDLVSEGMVFQLGDYNAFMPQNQTKNLGNDDQSFWGLAAMTAAEAGLAGPGKDIGDWADVAANVFNTQTLRWNDSSEECGGGLKWQIFGFNPGYNYKNSISTGNFFLLSARLAQFTGNSTYQEWAKKAFKWTQDIGLMSTDFAVFDGTDDKLNCSSINRIQWTENSAIFAEGAALMYNLTKGDEKWKSAVAGLVNQSTVFQNGDSVLREVGCEKKGNCNIDQRAYKGVAIRSWARAARAAPFISDAITKMIKASASAAAKECESNEDAVKCALDWTGDSSDPVNVKEEGLGETNNALQAVQALLWPQAKALAGQSSNHTGNGSSGGNANGNVSGNSNGNGTSQGGNAPGSAGTITAPLILLIAATLIPTLFV